jgi:hypothetical protein
VDFVAKGALDLENPQYCMMNLEKLVVVSGPGKPDWADSRKPETPVESRLLKA